MNKISVMTLTPAESKRLIAKYIVTMPEVKKAFNEGIIFLQVSSSNAYIYEELSGNEIKKEEYVCGYTFESGGCVAKFNGDSKCEYYFDHGVEKHIAFPIEDPVPVFKKMGENDIIFKSGNFIDTYGNAGVYVGEADGSGGEYGKALPFIHNNGVKLFIPMILSKTVPNNCINIFNLLKIRNVDRDHSMNIIEAIGMPGRVITEIDAIKGLSGANASVVGMNGIGSGEGCITIAINGTEEERLKAWEIITYIKGEPKLEVKTRCKECIAKNDHGICPFKTDIFGK